MNSMAHDLKTPLAAMTGYAENLIDNIRTDKQEHYAKAIKDNVEYMNGLIKNVLLLSKSEAESITLDKKSVDLVNLAENQWEKYIPMAEDRDIQIHATTLLLDLFLYLLIPFLYVLYILFHLQTDIFPIFFPQR